MNEISDGVHSWLPFTTIRYNFNLNLGDALHLQSQLHVHSKSCAFVRYDIEISKEPQKLLKQCINVFRDEALKGS